MHGHHSIWAMNTSGVPENTFYDINKMPKDWGLWVFPISMSRIRNAQDAQKCIEYLKIFTPKKVSISRYGLNLIYSDHLYFYSEKQASDLKNSFTGEIIQHRNKFLKLREKNGQELQIIDAFHYQVWNQLYLSTKSILEKLNVVKRIYREDKLFQKYIQEDANRYNRELDENQLMFFLEEHLIFYLIMYGEIHLENLYVQGRQKWVLICYPGLPPRALVYLVQKNPFKFKTDNPYIGQYNLENNKFYDFTNINLETWDYE